MKRIYVFLFFNIILNGIIFSQSTIHSTTIGGDWHVPTTWIEGVVPGSSDNVIIQGPVIQHYVTGYDIHAVYCNDLTLTNTGSLRNGEYGGGTGTFHVFVYGNVVNDGIVENGASEYLYLTIYGNFENNNVWKPLTTELAGTNEHNISLANDKSFGGKILVNSPTLNALSDLYFTCDFSNEGTPARDHFRLNGNTLNLGTHSIELHKDCLINSGKLVGDFEIVGCFTVGWDVNDTLIFMGDITITDTLTGNEYGGGYGIYPLKIVGNVTNNGVIKDDYDTDNPLNNDDLKIFITGDINNHGVWKCNFTNLIGTSTQNIYQGDGKLFDSYLTFSNSSGDIRALSDINITKDINLSGCTLDMEDYSLNIQGWLSNGFLKRASLNNGLLSNITSKDSIHIKGKVTLDNGNVFQGSVIVHDTLQSNEYGGGSTVFTLLIDGDITNNGLIKNINSGDMLSLEVTGDIVNNGLWQNTYTKFKGSQDQHITSLSGHVFDGEFADLDSTSKLIANTDLTFEGNINLGRAVLDMQNNELTIKNFKWIYNGYLKNAKMHNGLLSDLRLLDEIEINGSVEIGEKVDAVANIVVNDTLTATMNNGGTATYYFWVYGSIENRGLIGQIYDDLLIVKVNGNIINKGIWNVYQNYLLFFQNSNNNSVSCFNTGTTNMQFNGSIISGNGAPAYTIISGGGTQTITQNQSYDLSIQYAPTSGDSTALLNIDCAEIGTLNNIYLVGHNYNTTVNVEEVNNPALPDEFILHQNYPNPFNPITKISWQSPVGSWQTLKVYDVLGNEVVTLVDEYKPAGSYTDDFSISSINHHTSSGVYFYQLKSGDFIQTKKMLMIK